jgi:hypothetical protein
VRFYEATDREQLVQQVIEWSHRIGRLDGSSGSKRNWKGHSTFVCWDFLNGFIPGKCRVMDIDGFIHLRANGADHFLFIEHKAKPMDPNSGQAYALRALAKQPNTTVIVAYFQNPGARA